MVEPLRFPRCTYCDKQSVSSIKVPVMRRGRKGHMIHHVCPDHHYKTKHYEERPLKLRPQWID